MTGDSGALDDMQAVSDNITGGLASTALNDTTVLMTVQNYCATDLWRTLHTTPSSLWQIHIQLNSFLTCLLRFKVSYFGRDRLNIPCQDSALCRTFTFHPAQTWVPACHLKDVAIRTNTAPNRETCNLIRLVSAQPPYLSPSMRTLGTYTRSPRRAAIRKPS